MSSSYTENSIIVVRDDIKRIQLKPDVYIGYVGQKGITHMFKEILQNAIDEYMNTPYEEIFVTYDESTNIFTIEDMGRGVPQGVLTDICTVIQSSGKFKKGDNNAYKIAAGKNGMGATAVNALSTYFNMTSTRDGKEVTVKFDHGKAICEPITKKVNSKKTGTYVEWQPDPVIFGKRLHYDYNDVLNLCETMNYLTTAKIKVHIDLKNGKEINETYKSKHGIEDLLNKLAPNRIAPIIHIKATGGDANLPLNSEGDYYKECDIVLTYAPADVADLNTLDDQFILSYSNYCTTIDGGTHVDGFKDGIAAALSDYVKTNIFNKKDSKLTLSSADCRNGLIAVVVGNHMYPIYSGQVKEKLANDDMAPFVRRETKKFMKAWLKDNEKNAKALGQYIKDMCRLRNNALEAKKNTVRKDVGNFFSKERPKGFKPAKNAKMDPVYGKELFIVEGDSAGGSANIAKEPYQAIYYLRGVPKNTFGLTTSQAMENEELRGLVSVLGTGIGKNFKLEDCNYTKIIILTDADVDGNNITSVACTFFVTQMRELVEAGMIYKVEPPLYKIKSGKKDIYIKDKKEYATFVRKAITKSVTVDKVLKGKHTRLSDNDIDNLIEDTLSYYNGMKRVAHAYVVNPLVLESVIYYLDDIKKIEKKFRFIKVIEHDKSKYIRGTYNKEYQYIKLDSKFFTRVQELGNILLSICPNGEMFKINDEDKLLSLYGILDIFDNYVPANRERFKGLGEMNPSDLLETSLLPENRNLIQFTTDNYERTYKGFQILHEKNPKGAIKEERLKMVQEFKITPDDIEN